jgi:hypothetical protein
VPSTKRRKALTPVYTLDTILDTLQSVTHLKFQFAAESDSDDNQIEFIYIRTWHEHCTYIGDIVGQAH